MVRTVYIPLLSDNDSRTNFKLFLFLSVLGFSKFSGPVVDRRVKREVLSSCTGTQGNSHCIVFVYDSLAMCGVLFGLLYWLLCIGTRGQSQKRDFVFVSHQSQAQYKSMAWLLHWLDRLVSRPKLSI